MLRRQQYCFWHLLHCFLRTTTFHKIRHTTWHLDVFDRISFRVRTSHQPCEGSSICLTDHGFVRKVKWCSWTSCIIQWIIGSVDCLRVWSSCSFYAPVFFVYSRSLPSEPHKWVCVLCSVQSDSSHNSNNTETIFPHCSVVLVLCFG